jgi:bifunctional DNA-binding transcriptional regulator/antitoxin component of YhaV-PrlF toxin-antitoxin module
MGFLSGFVVGGGLVGTVVAYVIKNNPEKSLEVLDTLHKKTDEELDDLRAKMEKGMTKLKEEIEKRKQK